MGIITKDATKCQILIRDRHKIKNIFPIFYNYPLLTSKYYNYMLFKKAFDILENKELSKEEKNSKLFLLKNSKIPHNFISPA